MQVDYQTESDTKPNKFEIENILNGNCDIVINDEIKKVDETYTDDEGNEVKTTKYTYNSYRITTLHRDTLEEELKSKEGYKIWLDFVINQATEEKAAEVRAKRDELLKETDSEMCLDRMGIEIPEGSTFSSWLVFLKSLGNSITGDMAQYRQALRDIPQQEGFPYNVIWPTKKD